MTKQEYIDALVKGCSNHDAEYVNVRRETVLIALGAIPVPKQEEPSVAPNQRTEAK